MQRNSSRQFFLGLSSLLLLLGGSLMAAIAAAQSEPAYAPGDANTCLACHRAGGLKPAEEVLHSIHGIAANPRSPFAAGGKDCQTCHGPSNQHLGLDATGKRPPPAIVFDDRVAAATRNSVCLNCHQDNVGQQWHGSTHQFEELACTDCHQIHIAKDPILTTNAQAPICFTCHQQQRAQFQRPSAHPVERGLLGCGDCHEPHGGNGVRMLKKNTVNEMCYDCHAEKRGPFLWEHAPVREDCTNCHVPHGSNQKTLLVARPPFLCQQCHLAQFHPSTAFGGDDVPPIGASRLLLNRNCMNCHVQVHGSNHPSGSGLIR